MTLKRKEEGGDTGDGEREDETMERGEGGEDAEKGGSVPEREEETLERGIGAGEGGENAGEGRSAPEWEEKTLERGDRHRSGRRRRWKGDIGAGDGGGDAGKGRSTPERERGDEGWPGAGVGSVRARERGKWGDLLAFSGEKMTA
ncbi:hypothetical protein ACLOJK_008726 [Asimina triloba]